MEKTFDRTYIIMFNDERIGFYQGQVVKEHIILKIYVLF